MNKFKCIISVMICIFLVSCVSVSVSMGEEDFLEDEFNEDEFDDDDELFSFDEEEEVKPPVKKEPKKKEIKKEEVKKKVVKKEIKEAVKEEVKKETKEVAKKEVKKEAKKEKKKEVKKKSKKEKATKKVDIPEFDDDDLFGFEEEEGIEKEAPVKKTPEEEVTFKIYRAKKNDTLYTIAEKYYSDPDRWEEIWKYNKYIKDPTVLYKGDNVIVPVRVTKIKDEIKSEELKEVQEKMEKKYEKQVFFSGDVDYDGRIISFKEKGLLMQVSGNIVFVNIGSEDDVKPDVLYTIYREKGSVARKIGILRITEDIGENDSTALIVSSFDPIKVGDSILLRK